MAQIGPMDCRVTLYDDDHFYMGSVLAEVLVARGCKVDLVTPAAKVAEWTQNTLEQAIIMRRLLGIGVQVHACKAPLAIGADEVTLGCTWGGAENVIAADAVVLVTSRNPHDDLFRALRDRQGEWAGHGIRSVRVIGDAAAPAPIAWATYAGRRFAEELDHPEDAGDIPSFRREVAGLDPGTSRLPVARLREAAE